MNPLEKICMVHGVRRRKPVQVSDGVGGKVINAPSSPGLPSGACHPSDRRSLIDAFVCRLDTYFHNCKSVTAQ